MTIAESRIERALQQRKQSTLLRELREPDVGSADFSSNDYLSFSRNETLKTAISIAVQQEGLTNRIGAAGSRLLSGHSSLASDLERTAARFHRAPTALLFNSGYDANLALFSTLPARNDVVVYDALIHASVHDGMRLGRARDSLVSFRHNSVSDLQHVLSNVLSDRQTHGFSKFVVWVAIESVYSMDGDMAPLASMLEMLNTLSTDNVALLLIVDEAHAVGLNGPSGEGCVVDSNLQNHPNLAVRVVTYGKAFGAHGAAVLTSSLFRQYLINYARPFIYSTALPPHSIVCLKVIYGFCATVEAHEARVTLSQRRNFFRKLATSQLPSGALLEAGTQSPIQSVLVSGNDNCVKATSKLRRAKVDVYPIRSPTVPKGTERIRVVIHAHNTEDEIRKLVSELAEAIRDINDEESLRTHARL